MNSTNRLAAPLSLKESTFKDISANVSPGQNLYHQAEPRDLAWALGRLARQKDTQAWALVIEKIGPDIQRLAMRISEDFSLAEDAVQETLMLIRDHADQFVVHSSDANNDARGWIHGIATNVSLQMIRRHRRQMRRDHHAGLQQAMAAPPQPDPAMLAERRDENRLLRQELAEMPDAYGQALALRYFAGHDYPALASLLRITVNTARNRIQRGLKMLRDRLNRCGVTLSIAGLAGLLGNLGAAPVASIALPASTLGIINSSAVPTATMASVSVIATGGFFMASVLATILAAAAAVTGWSFGWWASVIQPTSPMARTELSMLAVQEPPPQPLGNPAPARPFIMQVKIATIESNALSKFYEANEENQLKPSLENQFMIPLNGDYSYDFTVDWGDGTCEVKKNNVPCRLHKRADYYIFEK